MIAVAVKDYDDENITEECETGWKRFCIEVLVRTHYYIVALCRHHRRKGFAIRLAPSRKDAETLRRQVAAYQWVFCGTGGGFTFDQTCHDIGLDPHLVRQKLLSQAQPCRDINLLVDWVSRQTEKFDGYDRRRQDSSAGGVGTGIVHRVRDIRCQERAGAGRRGAQSHAVCRGKNRNAHRRRTAGAR